jgi:hypothetical protein
MALQLVFAGWRVWHPQTVKVLPATPHLCKSGFLYIQMTVGWVHALNVICSAAQGVAFCMRHTSADAPALVK